MTATSKARNALAAAVVAALALAGCSAEGTDTTLTTEQAQAEYDAIVTKYPLPNGERYPALMFKSASGEKIVYDRKYAAASLARAHAVCRYLRFWVNSADKRSAEAAQALASLERLNNDPESIPAANQIVPHVATIVAKAKLGDPAEAQLFLETSCSG